MEIVLKELFSTPIGLLSLFTIGFMIVMGFWLNHWIKKHMDAGD
jgi:hypothetical protein